MPSSNNDSFLPFLPLFQEDAATVRARVDSDLNAGIDPTSDANVDTREGAFYFDVSQPLVFEFARLWDALGTEVISAASPATAWGDYLDAHADVFGLARKVAVQASGQAIFTGAPNTPVGQGVQVSPEPISPTDEPPVFQTTMSGVTSAGLTPPTAPFAEVRTLAPPSGVTASAGGTTGTLAPGSYFYLVTALNAQGETSPSSEVSIAITAGQEPTVSWTAEAGASSYRVYRGTAAGAESGFVQVASNVTSLTDTGGLAYTTQRPPSVNTAGTDIGTLPAGTYYYVLTTLSSFGETIESQEFATTLSATGAIYLGWTGVTGAVGYNVYRGVAPGYESLLYSITGAPPVTDYLDDNSATLTTLLPPDIDSSAGVELPIQALDAAATGNVSANAINQIVTPAAGIDGVANPVPTLGGADPESDDALRARVLSEYTGQGAGTIADYQRWALSYAGVGQAFVVPIASGPGTVQVTVLDANGQPVSASIVAGLQAELDPVAGQGHGLAPIGAAVTVTTPALAAVGIDATITYDSGYSADGTGGTVGLRTQITAAQQAYFARLGLGDTVIYDNVLAQFFTVIGILDVVLHSPTTNITNTNSQVPVLGTITLS